MKKLMNILLLSCFRATELVEKKLLFKLSPIEKCQLSIHKAICEACKVYEKQSIIIDKSLSLHIEKEKTVEVEELKEKIIEKLK